MTDELTVNQITWTLADAPWAPTTGLLKLTANMLPTITDPVAAVLMEWLAETLIRKNEELDAVRAVESVGLELLHDRDRKVKRLKTRLIEMRNVAKPS